MTELSGHGGAHAVAVARAHGVQTMFTLSGGHVFPLYDGAVQAEPPMRLLDVRHEQTAVFAAEATGKLGRRPGLAVVTAGPGVTNGVSAIATAHFNGSPVVVLGGRAPDHRWGAGLLQELDQPPLVRTITKYAGTVHAVDKIAAAVDDAFRLAGSAHRGPVFLDVPMDHLFDSGAAPYAPTSADRTPPDPDDVDGIARLLAAAERPVLVFGSDVWLDGAESAARAAAEELGVPVVANGQGRGVLPPGHRLLATRARKAAFGEADLVIVVGTPLDFRLGFGEFAGGGAKVAHVMDAADQVAGHVALAGSAGGDLTAFFTGLAGAAARHGLGIDAAWPGRLADAAAAAIAGDADVLGADSDPIHPGRVYGELLPLLDDDAVVIGDGGDFVSYAGKYVEPKRPGNWLDPGPYGCLGTGLGYAIAARVERPSSQVVLLLGDGAAGFSLMDVDTMVRHKLPVVMVCGNNGVWGLEKHPMQFLYGYDVAAELTPRTRYDEVVKALGGDGEMVTSPAEIGPALRRAFDSGVPYMVNVVTDPDNAYPRSTTGI
jgi:acetolactate synthase-1/2/3 large subunit